MAIAAVRRISRLTLICETARGERNYESVTIVSKVKSDLQNFIYVKKGYRKNGARGEHTEPLRYNYMGPIKTENSQNTLVHPLNSSGGSLLVAISLIAI